MWPQSRDQGAWATSQGAPGATGNRGRQDPPREPPVGAGPANTAGADPGLRACERMNSCRHQCPRPVALREGATGNKAGSGNSQA